ncbi:FG-GAP repeat protein [Gemmata sp. SH-PL17]|uniref:FG-GAP repeat domain-containing protein n=1 Tax=Gemmata sp. SH-PL17 TaxID=1630693 RepID=UPI00078DC4BA|nr:VCBS repeat-containing protein [Gemmata sp. SH-PL17]AMV24032.1 FG-GAP repeat protein [Gemmata sp. SH-PL17]
MPSRRPRIRRLFAWAAARVRVPRPFVTPQCRPLTSALEVLEDRVVPASLPAPTRFVLGDVDGDMIPDLVTASGPGRTPFVRAVSGRDGHALWDAFPYDPQFLGGVELAIGDVTGDGRADVITGAGPGAAPHATVIDGATGRIVRSWLAFDAGFHGGISVGAGDVTGDGRFDIIVGAGAGAGPHVEVFDGASGTLASGPIGSFLAFAATFRGGVSVSAGDVTGDGRSDIIVGAGPGAGPHVVAIDAGTGRVTHSFFVYAPAFRGGVRVAAADVDGNGAADIIATPLGGPARTSPCLADRAACSSTISRRIRHGRAKPRSPPPIRTGTGSRIWSPVRGTNYTRRAGSTGQHFGSAR